MPLMRTDSVLLPGKRPTAMQAPSGSPISVPSSTAPPLTCSDSTTISATVWSKVASKAKASEKVAAKAGIGGEHTRNPQPAGTRRALIGQTRGQPPPFCIARSRRASSARRAASSPGPKR